MAGLWQQQRHEELKTLALAAQARFTSDALDFDSDNEDAASLERLIVDVYALEMCREELHRAEQMQLDEAIAFSLGDTEVQKLLRPSLELNTDDEEGDVVIISASDLERKPAPSCTCCLATLVDEKARRILPCGHLYCKQCVATRAGMSVRDRTLLPAHCCRKEFPVEYVKEALRPADFALYQRFLKEKDWKMLDLESDKEYAHAVKEDGCVQCPGCGVGVSRISGCNRMKCLNGHEFCFDCGKVWKTCPCHYPGGGY
ncbi:hypothetical protein Gpo141_00003428 [Globisporangium polare]